MQKRLTKHKKYIALNNITYNIINMKKNKNIYGRSLVIQLVSKYALKDEIC